MAWKILVSMVTMCVVVQMAQCKPVEKRGPAPIDPVEGGSKAEEDVGTGLEYDRYLRQVVEVLESDDGFRKKLETANISDIKSGAIAMHLELVNNTIRTKLDEIKRMEVQRLQELARIKMRSMSGTEVLHFIAAHGGVNRMDIPAHLDLRNPHSFEMKDLENLIKKTTHDLEVVDKRRREEFKTYEMEKEYEYQEKLKNLPEEEKKKELQHHEELQKKHKQHEKINHPGSKDQFQEVWEKEDHLEDQDFDPKTFFMMHDLNGDKMWDIQEVEAVLQRELDKVYDARNSPDEDDPMERYEEMNRMREHVFGEIDQNKDFMITMDEFLSYTGKQGEKDKFKEDEGWETVDEKPQFTDEELQEYVRQYHAQPGVVPPPVDGNLRFSPEEQLQHQQQQMMHGAQTGQQGMPQQGMPQHGMPQQGVPQQGMPQQGMPQHGMPQQGMLQQGMPQHGMPQQGMPQHGMPQQGMPQQGMLQQEMPQHGMPQHGMPQQGIQPHGQQGVHHNSQQQQQQFGQQQVNHQQPQHAEHRQLHQQHAEHGQLHQQHAEQEQLNQQAAQEQLNIQQQELQQMHEQPVSQQPQQQQLHQQNGEQQELHQQNLALQQQQLHQQNADHHQQQLDQQHADHHQQQLDQQHADHQQQPQLDQQHADHQQQPQLDQQHADHQQQPQLDQQHADHQQQPQLDQQHADHQQQPQLDQQHAEEQEQREQARETQGEVNPQHHPGLPNPPQAVEQQQNQIHQGQATQGQPVQGQGHPVNAQPPTV